MAASAGSVMRDGRYARETRSGEQVIHVREDK
jgi:hypothetical protein